jgi:uncharacterized membrane protein YraQ (UPF0718 family)
LIPKEKKQPNKKATFFISLKKATLEFISLLPTILAVVGLVACFQVYITPQMLSNLFGHGTILDILDGTFLGAISSGNGAISYVVAEGLKTQGVSTYALIAFIMAWTTLSFTHIPAEASVFGVKFTALRNLLTFLSTMIIAYLSTITLELFS